MDIILQNVSKNFKLIYVNGSEVGSVHRQDVSIGLTDKGYKKQSLWTGNFTIYDYKIYIGRTEKASDLLSKIRSLARSYLNKSGIKEKVNAVIKKNI
jgi:hypothetical protein